GMTAALLMEGGGFREGLPDDLADALPARDSETGRFRRKLGHALRQRVERRFGDEDLYIARSDDRHKKVALWRVRSGQERRGRRESPAPVPPATSPTGPQQDDAAALSLS